MKVLDDLYSSKILTLKLICTKINVFSQCNWDSLQDSVFSNSLLYFYLMVHTSSIKIYYNDWYEM